VISQNSAWVGVRKNIKGTQAPGIVGISIGKKRGKNSMEKRSSASKITKRLGKSHLRRSRKAEEAFLRGEKRPILPEERAPKKKKGTDGIPLKKEAFVCLKAEKQQRRRRENKIEEEKEKKKMKSGGSPIFKRLSFHWNAFYRKVRRTKKRPKDTAARAGRGKASKLYVGRQGLGRLGGKRKRGEAMFLKAMCF